MPIDVLPDEVLLEIFDFYVGENEDEFDIKKEEIEGWQTLVHVCRRWRTIVFASTIRLNLRLVCTSKTPAKDTLDVWPALPLLIDDDDFLSEGVDNIIAALKYSDRVDEIHLSNVGDSAMEKVLAAMQVPYPDLTHLELDSSGTVPVVPDSFLGGHAPNLQMLGLDRIPVPGLPKLLSHSTELSNLYLYGIPHSGYFSPEAMVTCLSTLTGLDEFGLEFESPQSFPDQSSRRSPLLKRSVLPALKGFVFKGVSEYLEVLISLIDSPLLERLNITFFNQIDFHTPHIVQFVRRTPVLKALEKARLTFGADAAVNLSSATTQSEQLNLKILCRELDWQVSSLEQLCILFFPSIFEPEDLYIFQRKNFEPDWKDNVDSALWLALLHPFTSLENLYLSKELASRILPALQELVGGRTTEVLPSLQNIFLEELRPSSVPVQEAIGTIDTARQVSGHPVTFSLWERDLKLEGYRGP
jgi:hypothetical protein